MEHGTTLRARRRLGRLLVGAVGIVIELAHEAPAPRRGIVLPARFMIFAHGISPVQQ
jgi:hypothetical protein